MKIPLLATILALAATSAVFANGGAWRTGVPGTGSGSASVKGQTTDVSIERETLKIDLHAEYAAVEVQHELARWLVDRGVVVVVGSHPHCGQALDFYHGCPIAYSLGNLVFDGAATVASWNQGALLEIGVDNEVRAPTARLILVVL